MTENEIIYALRSVSESLPIVVINKLKELYDGNIEQFEMIRIFKEAFPEIPLRVLNEASTAQTIVGSDGVEDEALNILLGPWFPRKQ